MNKSQREDDPAFTGLVSLLGGNQLLANIMLNSKEEKGTAPSLFSTNSSSNSTFTNSTSYKFLKETQPPKKASISASATTKYESSSDKILLWDTKVRLVNPSTDIVLAPYKQFSDAYFYGRICAEHEAGNIT